MNWVIIFAVGVAAGILGGQVVFPPEVQELAEPLEKEIATPAMSCELPEGLKNITEEEFRAYLAAATAEEKLKKADEILSKMMQALVADFGLRIQQQEIMKSTEGLTTMARCEPRQPSPVSRSSVAPTPAPTPNARGNAQLAEWQQSLQRTANETELFAALEKNPLNLTEALKGAKNLSPTQIEMISGRFQGVVQLNQPRAEVWSMELSLENRGRDQFRGRSTFVLRTSNGREIARTRGSGDLNRNYQTYGGAILVSGGPYTAELYYVPQLDQFAGHLAETRNATIRRIGLIQLKRIP